MWKEEIANHRNDYEDACLRRLVETIPPDCHVTILADRGFGDQKLFAFLMELNFAYVIRFRGNISITDAKGETKRTSDWVGKGGRARKLANARVTAKGQAVGAVVCVHAKGMKDPWCLATADAEAKATTLNELIPTMPEHRLGPLIAAFAQSLDNAQEFNGLFAQAK